MREFGNIAALVVGDVMLDSWLRGPSTRMAQEAPVPVVTVEHIEDAPGGAANCAVNLAVLGAQVRLIGVTGADGPGTALIGALLQHGVDTDGLIITRGRRTSIKRRVMTGGQIVARFDEENRLPLTPEIEREVVEQIHGLSPSASVVIACDYGGGLFTDAVRDALRDLPMLIVDAHDLAPWADCHPLAVLPNFEEAQRLLGETGHGDEPADFVAAQAGRLEDATGADLIVTTLDGEGTLLHQAGHEPHRTYARPTPNRMSTGAGDTFTATFALALAAGATPEEAADLAQTAASVVVHRPGTAVCTWDDLFEATQPEAVVPPERLPALLEAAPGPRARVVFTNGSFDVLNRGDVTYLQQARQLGDVLVVALNSDKSVEQLKGPDHLVNTLEDRAAVLRALGCVDHITVFDEETPAELIRMLRPDVYVTGGDDHPDVLPEAAVVKEYGGEVRVLDYVPDQSTTAITNRGRT
ncbi:bifunctional heptose 7-phosphate kinase/heptose 1-phosphate adenyltransferase [Streptosporangiaceae bacterium NEAU-GS5]|nr:bifunctional heptose 7-phosphate kinase/heptose 1-phosphate adenyltransferase [Streptosporangiaceae bacterium NEAU-GS5]